MDNQTPPLIMVIDDDESTLDLVTRYLQARGVTVAKATTGTEALSILQQSETAVHLIFLDLGLPGMSGYEIAAAIRDMPMFAHIPIVAVTARTGYEVGILAADAGFDRVITKPFAPKQLLEVLVSENILPNSST